MTVTIVGETRPITSRAAITGGVDTHAGTVRQDEPSNQQGHTSRNVGRSTWPCAENFGHQCTRPRTLTPDTLATSPDAVRKPASEKTSRAREGVRTGTVAYQAVVYPPAGNRSACQVRGQGWAAAHPARAGPRRCVCLGTVRLGGGRHGVHHRSGHWQPGVSEPVASGARWVGLDAGAVAEVAEGAAEGVGEWLGGLVPG